MKKNFIFTICFFAIAQMFLQAQTLPKSNSAATADNVVSKSDCKAPMHDLTLDEIRNFTTGFFSIERTNDFIQFQRFPQEVHDVFESNPTWSLRAESTSGIKISFYSNTSRIYFSGKVFVNSPQTEPFVILINDSLIEELSGNDSTGEFGQMIFLPETGDKMIEIYFPSYSKGCIRNLKIEENASLIAVKSNGTILALGNSITQQGGRYKGFLDIVASELNLDIHDVGVGGHIFQAESLPFVYVKNPVLIFVAYGTNDWLGGRPAENARVFLDRLTTLYPSTSIVILEPLNRYSPVSEDGKHLAKNKQGCSIMDYRRQLRAIEKGYPNLRIFHYNKLIPDNPRLFADGVHPTSEGHVVYGKNLAELLKKNFPRLKTNNEKD